MKKNKILKILSVILTVLILLPTLASCSSCKKKVDTNFTIPTRTIAGDEVFEYGYYKYQLFDDGTAMIIEYTGSETNLTVPDSIDGHTVVEIYDATFMPTPEIQGPTKLTSITLNDSLEKIGLYAFYNCQNLSSVTFGEKIWSIGYDAFEGTPWLKAQSDDFVTVGNGVLIKYQGKDSHVVIPDGIRHISAAFSNNENIKRVTMGDSVLTIGTSAFSGCLGLKSVEFGKNVKLIDSYAFASCYELVSGDLPDLVEQIGDSAFYNCYSLRAAKLGKSLKRLGASAFEYSALKTLEMPATVTTIDEYAFGYCLRLALVFYGGTEEQFKAIKFEGDEGSNYPLKDAIKIYGE